MPADPPGRTCSNCGNLQALPSACCLARGVDCDWRPILRPLTCAVCGSPYALTPAQSAALAAWQAEDGAGRADLLAHLHELADAEEQAAASPDCDDPDLSRSADDCRDSARRYAAAAALLAAFGGPDA